MQEGSLKTVSAYLQLEEKSTVRCYTDKYKNNIFSPIDPGQKLYLRIMF